MTAPKNMAKITTKIPVLAVQNDDHVHTRGTEVHLRSENSVAAAGSMVVFSDSSFAGPELNVSDELLELPGGASLASRPPS